MKYKHLLVIPAYNCAPQLKRLLVDLQALSENWKEVWIIDNGSTDGIGAVVKESANIANLRFFLNASNYGLGGTHKIAFLKACEHHFDSITIFHGDYQAKLEDAILAQKKFEIEHQCDAILGSRFVRASKLRGYSLPRRVYNKIFNLLFSIRLRRRILDLGSGLNLFSARLVRRLNLEDLPNDLTFNIGLLKHMVQMKAVIEWLPISWTEDDQVSNVKVIKQTANTIKLLIGKFPPREKFNNTLLTKEILVDD